MPRHNGNTRRARSRARRAWLQKRGLIDRTHKTSPIHPSTKAVRPAREDDEE
jgi:hypothetical protein